MPTYTFKNLETGEVFDKICHMSEREEFIKNNNVKQLIHSAPPMSYAGTMTKPAAGFRDLLKSMKKAHPRSKINDF